MALIKFSINFARILEIVLQLPYSGQLPKNCSGMVCLTTNKANEFAQNCLHGCKMNANVN